MEDQIEVKYDIDSKKKDTRVRVPDGSDVKKEAKKIFKEICNSIKREVSRDPESRGYTASPVTNAQLMNQTIVDAFGNVILIARSNTILVGLPYSANYISPDDITKALE